MRNRETPITMSEYSEVWITSNQEAPLYIKPGDRRQLIFKASELLQQNEQFFKKTTEQVQNINIQRAWFDFFMTRDITHFSPSKDPPNNTISDYPIMHGKNTQILRVFFPRIRLVSTVQTNTSANDYLVHAILRQKTYH